MFKKSLKVLKNKKSWSKLIISRPRPSTSRFIGGFLSLLEQIPSSFLIMLSLLSRKAFACDINPDVDFQSRTFFLLLHSHLS